MRDFDHEHGGKDGESEIERLGRSSSGRILREMGFEGWNDEMYGIRALISFEGVCRLLSFNLKAKINR